MNKNKIRGREKSDRGREVGEKGEGSGGKGGGNWEWGTPLSTPSYLDRVSKLRETVMEISPECNLENIAARSTEKAQCSLSTRFSDKCRKFTVDANSRYNLHRQKVFVGQMYIFSNFRQSVKIKGDCNGDKRDIRQYCKFGNIRERFIFAKLRHK